MADKKVQNDHPDWVLKKTRDAYYSTIPYGLRQQMNMTGSNDPTPPVNTQVEKPADQQLPLNIVIPLS